MVDDILRRFLGRGQKPRDHVLVHRVAVGDVDQLVIGRQTLFLDVETGAIDAFDIHLVQLEIAEGPDDRIHLTGHQ